MAMDVRKACLWFQLNLAFSGIALILLSSNSITVSHGSIIKPQFRDMPSGLLLKHIQKSRHLPICVVFRKLEEGSLLEKRVYSLWENRTKEEVYASWQFTSFSPNKNNLAGEPMPRDLPTLQCYLGLGKAVVFKEKPLKKNLIQWLHHLSDTHAQQIQDATWQQVDEAVARPGLVIIGFPGLSQHYEVEEVLAKIRAKWTNLVTMMIVHVYADDARRLEEKYSVVEYPTVVFIENSFRTSDEPEVVHVISDLDVNFMNLNTYMAMRQVPALSLDMENFAKQTQEIGRYYQPILVCFYASWAPRVENYLFTFQRAAEEFKELNTTLRFGLVDVTKSFNVINVYLDSNFATTFPFTLLFHPKRINGRPRSLLRSPLNKPFPTPATVYEFMGEAGEPLMDVSGNIIMYRPWGTADPTQVSALYEGPYGSRCSRNFNNNTDNIPKELPDLLIHKRTPKRRVLPKKVEEVEKTESQSKNETVPKQEKPAISESWHRKFDADRINKKLDKIGSLPVLTDQAWSEVVERSHAPNHPLVQANKWSGEVTKVTVVIFIIDDCGNCQRNLGTFQEIEKASRYIDGASVYLMNCTSDPLACRRNEVTGYPTIVAFRGLGWLQGENCVSGRAAMSDKFIRIDYHGVLLVKHVMTWLSNAAASAVTNHRFTRPTTSDVKEDVRIIGTLMPKTSQYLPFIPGRKWDYFYSYECFRLACERLYGYASCGVYYSQEIPESQYSNEDQDMVVSKVQLIRRDGMEAVITQIGTTFVNLFEEEAESAIHKLHTPHRYRIRPGLHCEDDHGFCTDLIVDFTHDHGRLPVTHLTLDAFHIKSRYIPHDMPVLMALVHKENITDGTEFSQMLTSVAYEVYDSVMVVTVDVDSHPWWAEQFVPVSHRTEPIIGLREGSGLFRYPRFCMVYWHDHHHAAFYPAVSDLEKQTKPPQLTKQALLTFIKDFLTHPAKLLQTTAHF